MLKKYLLILFIAFSTQIVVSQTYTFKKKFTPTEEKEFLGMTKEIFIIDNNISYSTNTLDAITKIKDIKNILFNGAYLEKAKAKLAKDSLDAFALNDLGNYHNKNGDPSLAKKYFTKSLANLNLKKFKTKDSAQFYSYRSLLKFNLGKEDDAMTDLEKGLKINPTDTIAMTFYPLMLIQKKDFTKAKSVCINALEKKNDNPQLAFLYLNLSFMFESLEVIMDLSKKKENLAKNYDEFYDIKTIKKYTELYKDNLEVQNLKKTAEVMTLYVKMMLFEKSDGDDARIFFNFTATDKKRINELIVEFKELVSTEKINSFSGNKSLALLYFFLEDKEKAIECAKKAVTLFPDKQRTSDFNPNDSYDLLLTLYHFKKDISNFKKTLEEKILKSAEFEKNTNDYINMGYLYLYEKDYEQSEVWCKKAREIDPDNFKALCLLAHLKFLNSSDLGEFYLQQAARQVKNESDNYSIGLQSSIYMILKGLPENAKVAFDNIEISRKMFEEKCLVCDELTQKYIQVTP